MKASILLEDGTVIEGKAFGAIETTIGEVVFNTGMTGYQEVLTDPSYAGQIVVMTYPLIGNYGISEEAKESETVKVKGFVVGEYCSAESNWKSEKSLSQYLEDSSITGICRVDTRMITKKIRSKGTMNGLITTEEITPGMYQKLKEYSFPSNIVSQVSRKDTMKINYENPIKIGVVDFGIKNSIVKNLESLNVGIELLPYDISADKILSSNYSAVLLSNGPGDPKDVGVAIKEVEKLIGKIPLFGICLGHQILALALGADTYKLKFGHRGSNHPVIELDTNKILITSQNHGYAVVEDSLKNNIKLTYKNVNDETVEGFKHEEYKIYTTQFHPEAAPGPSDAKGIFKKWLEIIEQGGNNA